MRKKTQQDVPKNIRELRRRLTELGNPWTVDPRLNDDDPLPDYPRGGQQEEQIPEEYRLAPLEPGTDLQSLIAAYPPANPFLKLRWVEAGILSEDEIEGEAIEFGEDKGGAA
jgi:hypothetical protein